MSIAASPAVTVPRANFQAPLATLYACHRRVIGYCATLRRLVLYVTECGCDRDAQTISKGVLRFFDNEVPLHRADEEQDLFPTLIESMAGSDAVCLHDLTRASAHQHQALAVQWRVLRDPLAQVAAGIDTVLPAREVEIFCRLWQEHIGLEESELLPMASRLLSDDELAQVDRRMRARRS